MNLKDKNLAEWLKKQPNTRFPAGKAYFRRYEELADFLKKEVHPLVAVGAAIKEGVFLNDHGPDHIEMVIQRASRLVSANDCDLSAHEVYLLLCAIQMHDAGNLMGRIKHEEQIRTWQADLERILGGESVEIRMITQIASAHGGSHNGDKDTIGKLARKDRILGSEIRPQLIAAILRFADELADDYTRAHRFALEKDAIPKEGKIFHKYSLSLHSVYVDMKGSDVDLRFSITDRDATEKYPKNGQEVYIFDEIINRTMKMHRERIYCSRFLRPSITLDTISVTVDVVNSASSEKETLVSIPYRLEEHGYPDEKTFTALCPQYAEFLDGRPLSGTTLLEALNQGHKS